MTCVLRCWQSMYVKVKRQKTTIFLLVEPADTVASVKQKLEELVQQVWASLGNAVAALY